MLQNSFLATALSSVIGQNELIINSGKKHCGRKRSTEPERCRAESRKTLSSFLSAITSLTSYLPGRCSRAALLGLFRLEPYTSFQSSRNARTNVLKSLRIPLDANTLGGQRSDDAKATHAGQYRLKVVPVMEQRHMACGW